MPAKPPYAELHWFPFYVRDFMASPDVQRMDDAEVGRYVRLMCRAFGNGMQEPSLEPSDLLASSNRVRGKFEERDGRLYNETLSRVWAEQQAKHAQAVRRGKLSGKKRRGKASRKRFKTVSKASRTGASDSGSRVSKKDLLTGGAGALALAERAPANPTLRDGKGPTSIADILARMPA